MAFQKGHKAYYRAGIPPSRKGAKLTDETKELLRQVNLGKKQSLETIKKKTETRLQRGYKHSIETKEKIGLANAISHKGVKLSEAHMQGLSKAQQKLVKEGRHHFWQGGISFGEYGVEFNRKLKEQVRSKYGKKCLECGYTQEKLGYKLPVHHIDYNKKNNSLDNLVPLCRSCHSQTNFKRKDWENYFVNKIEQYV